MALGAPDTPVCEAEIHRYGPRDVMPRSLRERHPRVIDHLDVSGGTKIVVRGRISGCVGNQTMGSGARPGDQGVDGQKGNPEGQVYDALPFG
jgi:hypothetical protein